MNQSRPLPQACLAEFLDILELQIFAGADAPGPIRTHRMHRTSEYSVYTFISVLLSSRYFHQSSLKRPYGLIPNHPASLMMPFKTLALITICLVASAISKPLPQSEDCTTDECLSLLLRGSIPPSPIE
ncbi:hypothetical protein PCANC_12954 [Puccinia coronata f. sp. avenae]|uniref:Uncharacterized protein n=1 Tax=Puccinia coronata f. sp. avenae TaxID=200324 RepID=A0A2N5SMR6_9BASI|nr:hypothetical protein PCANC_12954 [Puccinia coronata f. sp. avenae]